MFLLPSRKTKIYFKSKDTQLKISIHANFMVTPCIKQCWNLFITNWCT